ncbi:uncharacterized protein LOC128273987 [Anopheles cruzii]|uniref:uncharacterized protein LOC128273987 n=1 Tax=Anopheles cruzii TaxID=68878 RepID=UPI0022EC4F30|nr:uncharacterized protein LOC128273987 [Anopheles cruzii]
MAPQRNGVLIAVLAVVAFGALVGAETSKEETSVMQLIDEIDGEQRFPLFGGLTVERSNDYDGGRTFAGRSNEDLADRAVRYLSSHTLKFQVPSDENTVEEARSSRLKKMLLPLLLALKFKMAVVLPVLLAIVKFISLKGLIAGLLALKFSIFTVLKDLFEKKKERVTTAYITSAQPVNAEIVHQDWNRNGQAAAHELAYGAYPYSTLA